MGKGPWDLHLTWLDGHPDQREPCNEQPHFLANSPPIYSLSINIQKSLPELNFQGKSCPTCIRSRQQKDLPTISFTLLRATFPFACLIKSSGYQNWAWKQVSFITPTVNKFFLLDPRLTAPSAERDHPPHPPCMFEVCSHVSPGPFATRYSRRVTLTESHHGFADLWPLSSLPASSPSQREASLSSQQTPSTFFQQVLVPFTRIYSPTVTWQAWSY